MADLPAERVNLAFPFQFTGLDYLGPVWYKIDGSENQKAWICLFTCFVTRAVHLEVIRDMSANSFLSALRCFFARRGIPEKILSDNASQFLLTKSTIQKAWSEMLDTPEVIQYCRSKSIQWNTTTPLAPWQGGLYERLVTLTKSAFKKGVGQKMLNWDQLVTLTTEIEAVLNSRPITYVYEDINSPQVLMPKDFLQVKGDIGTPVFDEDPHDSDWKPKLDSADKLLKFWKSSQVELNRFWTLWQNEYLSTLREKSQAQHTQPRIQTHQHPKVDDTVLIFEENIPRGQWKMGCIQALRTSKDGLVRSADVMLSNKTSLSRPINHLYPLECSQASAMTNIACSTSPKRKLGWMVNIILIASIVLSFFAPTNSLSFNRTYQICNRGRNGHALSIPSIFSCQLPQNRPLERAIIHLWTQRQKPQCTIAWHCYVQTRSVVTRTSVLWGKGILADQVDYHSVLPTDCWEVLETKKWKNFSLVEFSPNFWSTNQTLVVQYKFCCYDVKNSITNFFIEQGEIASINGKTLVSDLQDLSACSSGSGHCQSQDLGVTIWNSTAFTGECSFVLHGTYKAVVSGRSIVISKIQGAFSYLGHSRPPGAECVPEDTLYTDQGAVFIQFQGYIPNEWKEIMFKNVSSPISPDNLDYEDLSNYKRFFLYKKIIDLENREFSLIWHQLCSIRQTQLTHIWQLIRIDPSLGARALLGRNDIHAEWAGEAMVFWMCRNVTPSKIHWTSRVNDTCYQYLSVQLEPLGPLWFVSPGSTDLIRISPTVDCEHASIPYFHSHDDHWYSAHGPVHVTKLPLEMVWKGIWETFSFDAPSLFSRFGTQLTNFVDIQHQLQRLQLMERTVDHLVNYTVSMSLDPTVIHNTLTGIGSGIAHIVEGNAKAIGHLITGTAQGLEHLLSGLLKGPLQLILNILIIGALLVGIIFVGYKIFMWKWKCRIMTKSKSSKLNQIPMSDKNQKSSIDISDKLEPSTSIPIENEPLYIPKYF